MPAEDHRHRHPPRRAEWHDARPLQARRRLRLDHRTPRRPAGDLGAKFVSHFAKPSRNTGDPLPDLLWHFVTAKNGITDINCELAVNSEYEQFIQHVIEGVTSQKDIAELMGRHKGTVSKWARKALEEGRLSGSTHKLLPPRSTGSQPVKSRYDPDEDDGEEDEENDHF